MTFLFQVCFGWRLAGGWRLRPRGMKPLDENRDSGPCNALSLPAHGVVSAPWAGACPERTKPTRCLPLSRRAAWAADVQRLTCSSAPVYLMPGFDPGCSTRGVRIVERECELSTIAPSARPVSISPACISALHGRRPDGAGLRGFNAVPVAAGIALNRAPAKWLTGCLTDCLFFSIFCQPVRFFRGKQDSFSMLL